MRHLLVIALAAVATAAAAQDIPIVQAGAGGRFERQIDAKSRIDGFTPGQVAAFRAAIAPVIEQLAAMPLINNPAPPTCRRLGSWVQMVNPDGVLGAEISMLTPINFQNGRCSRMTAGGMQFWVNRPGGGLDPSFALARDPSGGGADWHVLALKPARNPRLIEYELNGDDYVIITHGRAPLFRPVSMERYLQRRIGESRGQEQDRQARDAEDAFTEADLQKWLREDKPRLAAEYEEQARGVAPYAKPGQVEQMRANSARLLADMEAAMRQKVRSYAARDAQAASTPKRSVGFSATLAALTPAQRAMPACIDRGLEPEPNAACAPSRTLLEVNPAYFDKSRPSDIQLVILTTPSHRYHGESDDQLAARQAIWASIDRAALAARVR